MKKTFVLFIIFILLSIITIKAQSKSDVAGHVKYNFMRNQIDTTKKKNEFLKLQDLLMEQSKGIQFNLKFKDDISLFYVEDILENDATPMGVHFARNMVSSGEFYTNLKDKSILREYNSLGDSFLISYKTKSFTEWTLTKETKKIGKYKCYKATILKTISNPLKTTTFEIVAWYTPEIPVKFGIKEFNNLPGLILELKDTHFTFYASSINFLKKEDIIIKKPKGKAISDKEFQDKMLKASGFIMLDNKN